MTRGAEIKNCFVLISTATGCLLGELLVMNEYLALVGAQGQVR
jgi:hypothetical protein